MQALQVFTEFENVSYDQRAEHEFQQLRSIRIGTRDRKIASIALARNLTLVIPNRSDFARIPNLPLEDWSI